MPRKHKHPRARCHSAPTVRQSIEGSANKPLLDRKALQDKADFLEGAQSWDELAAFGETSIEGIEDLSPADRAWVLRWLQGIQVVAMTQAYALKRYRIAPEQQPKLRALLSKMAQEDGQFHLCREFTVYLDHLDFGNLEITIQAYRLLQKAFGEAPGFSLVNNARTLAKRLMSYEAYYLSEGETLTAARKTLVISLGDVSESLSTIYAQALGCDNLTEQQRMTLRVMQLDNAMQSAGHLDHALLVKAVLSLPSPEQADLPKRPDGSSQQALTPRGWAFLWGLATASFEQYPALLASQPGPDECEGCAGLRLVVQSLIAEPDQTDALLAQGVRALMRHQDEVGERLGSTLTVMLSTGPERLQFSPFGLSWTIVLEHMRWLVESLEALPTAYSRAAELTGLCRILEVLESFDELNASEVSGFDWLCAQSLAVQMHAVLRSPQPENQLVALLQGLCRCAVEGYPFGHVDFELGDEGEPLGREEAGQVLEQLESLALVRHLFDAFSEQVWHVAVGPIFKKLASVKDADVARTLAMARQFRADLTSGLNLFWLGYLEHKAGHAEHALDSYLQYWAMTGADKASAEANMKMLWTGSADGAQVEQLVWRLASAVAADPHQAEMQNLLVDAQARRTALEKRHQYEKTAVNRWPELTQPARKLLGVLNAVKHFGTFDELGSYAGMTGDWAKRHYAKLQETGMLAVTGGKYTINAHIRPLLEREAQHEVVGRIVRAQGTSAVKQVFNSQREFFIYQIMLQLCPNHLVFPNSSLQSIMAYDRVKELVSADDFGYYLRASVDLVLVSSTTYLPWLAIEVDSVWHDTERQQTNDGKKDRLFAAAGIPFMRLQPVGNPSETTVRAQVSQHLDELVRTLRTDLPGYEQARRLLADLAGAQNGATVQTAAMQG